MAWLCLKVNQLSYTRPLPICHKGTRVKGPFSWWWFKPYSGCKHCQGPSGLASESSTPKRPGCLALAKSLPLKSDDSAKPVATSSQVSVPDGLDMNDPTLEEIHASSSPSIKTMGPSGKAPSLDVTWLQEEVNKAMGHLLVTTRSSINAHWRKQVSYFGMAFTKKSLISQRPSRKWRPSVPALTGTWRSTRWH